MDPAWPDDTLLRNMAMNPDYRVVHHVVWRYLEDVRAAGPEAVSAWVSARRGWIALALPGVQIRASHAMSLAFGEDRSVEFPRLCAIRSGLENLRHGFLTAGLEDPWPDLALDRWDDVLEIAADNREDPRAEPPPGTPPDHWWWRAQTEGRPENKDYDVWDPDTY